MEDAPLYNPMELYTLDTHDSVIRGDPHENKITRFFWYNNPYITQSLCRYLEQHKIDDKIIDVGAGSAPFPPATHLLDFSRVTPLPNRVSFKLDLDFDTFPYESGFFNFLYCRHTLEDIQNPQRAFNELVRVSKAGYIETPSPLSELMRGVDSSGQHRGYIHHRYIVWSDMATNTLFFLPKYPIIETEVLNVLDEVLKKRIFLLNNYPVYWNNYYTWTSETAPPAVVVYRNDVNMDLRKDYVRLLVEAIDSSILNTNRFVSGLRGW